ncbi:MAG: septal ring lytic transglycosylase RlpA family protein [bacterium]
MLRFLCVLACVLCSPVLGAACAADASKKSVYTTATWYDYNEGPKRRMANGEVFDKTKPTIAHATLPLNTRAWLVNVNDPTKSIEVVVADRQARWVRQGWPNRAVDANLHVARALGFGPGANKDLLRIRVEVLSLPVGHAPPSRRKSSG